MKEFKAHEAEKIATAVVDTALSVHKELGPEFLEKCYQKALAYELNSPGLTVEEEVELPVIL